MEKRIQILTLAKAIESTFTSSEWTEVGYLTGIDEYIDTHPRLLRSLSWGDSDYKGHVLEAVAKMLEVNPNNLRHLLEYEPVGTWLKAHDLEGFQRLEGDAYGMTVPEVVPTGSRAALEALADAQVLLESRGPTSAVDRVHTGLHAFLKSACTKAGLAFDPDATANQLLKSLLDHHPHLQDLGPRDSELRRMIRTSASIVDSMGTVRNRASLAHPNEELLDADGALFVIHIGRSLLRLLDAKLKS